MVPILLTKKLFAILVTLTFLTDGKLELTKKEQFPILRQGCVELELLEDGKNGDAEYFFKEEINPLELIELFSEGQIDPAGDPVFQVANAHLADMRERYFKTKDMACEKFYSFLFRDDVDYRSMELVYEHRVSALREIDFLSKNVSINLEIAIKDNERARKFWSCIDQAKKKGMPIFLRKENFKDAEFLIGSDRFWSRDFPLPF